MLYWAPLSKEILQVVWNLSVPVLTHSTFSLAECNIKHEDIHWSLGEETATSCLNVPRCLDIRHITKSRHYTWLHFHTWCRMHGDMESTCMKRQVSWLPRTCTTHAVCVSTLAIALPGKSTFPWERVSAWKVSLVERRQSGIRSIVRTASLPLHVCRCPWLVICLWTILWRSCREFNKHIRTAIDITVAQISAYSTVKWWS